MPEEAAFCRIEQHPELYKRWKAICQEHLPKDQWPEGLNDHLEHTGPLRPDNDDGERWVDYLFEWADVIAQWILDNPDKQIVANPNSPS